MNSVMKHRGPDDSDIFYDENVCLGHNRLSVMDIENGHQPMSVAYGNKRYTIVYNGEIYNCDEIKKDIKKRGIKLRTNCDTEVVLYSYIIYGNDCPKYLNGIFAFCVYMSHARWIENVPYVSFSFYESSRKCLPFKTVRKLICACSCRLGSPVVLCIC